ncbi:MAG TPA: hypothetical protein VFB27_11555, partial [Opitutaceae bacterium]|nr:hypothetical protein [Opitutaceae bacterium]
NRNLSHKMFEANRNLAEDAFDRARIAGTPLHYNPNVVLFRRADRCGRDLVLILDNRNRKRHTFAVWMYLAC